MLPLLFALAAVAAPPPAKAPPAGPLTPGRHNVTVPAVGYDWAVAIHVPKNYDPAKPVPLVLVLHGAGGTGPMYLDKNNWADKADRETFVAVAPTGPPPRPTRAPNILTNPTLWNSGQLRPGLPRARIDDVAFFRHLLDVLGKRLAIDPKRVYVVGHSNGAGMAFRLGTEMSDKFAAVAAYAGYCYLDDPKPARPRPTLFVVGTEDPFTPLEGGGVRPPWGLLKAVPSVEETLTTWAKAIGCPAQAETVQDKDGLKIVRYGPKQGGVALTAYTITGQGHNWPGGKEGGLPERLLGPSVDFVNLTDVVWDFFKAHPMP